MCAVQEFKRGFQMVKSEASMSSWKDVLHLGFQQVWLRLDDSRAEKAHKHKERTRHPPIRTPP